MTRPAAETNEPEPPLLKRTAAERRWSIHPLGGSKPYFDFRVFRGRLLKTHIPSSARALVCTASKAPTTRRMARAGGEVRRRRGAESGLSIERLPVAKDRVMQPSCRPQPRSGPFADIGPALARNGRGPRKATNASAATRIP